MIEATPNGSQLLYEVDFSEATRHLLSVSLWIPKQASNFSASANTIKIVFPVWTPGSYMIREYTRNVESLTATAHASLHERSFSSMVANRIGKNSWEIETEPAAWIRVQYQLYCREMSVRTNWVEQDFGFITGAAAFPYVENRQAEPIELQLALPAKWDSVATSLKQLDRNGNSVRLRAENFDDLVDSPIAVGSFPVRSFEVGSHLHYLANVGDDELWDLEKATADVAKIVAEEHAFWGDVPYGDYWFMNLITETGGGLEHDNSTVLMASRWAMRKRESYLNWLALVSHEFFHTWNVRRLRPKALMTYDYQSEQYIHELWIAEGITSYFDDLFLIWAGLCTRDEYLCRLSKNIQSVQTAPGRLVQDLANASWDTWVKHYRPDENTHNSRISYYLKGAVLAWILDAEMQRVSNGKHDLAAVMRELWQEFRHTGYTISDFERLVEQRCGTELREWLESQVREPVDLDFAETLQHFGLRFKATNAKKDLVCEKPTTDVWIGSDSWATDGRVTVRRVYRGSPSDVAGLNVDDELVALDGYRLTADAWPDRLNMYQPGQELELLIARRGRLKQLTICLGRKPAHNWQLEIDPAATSDAKASFANWLQSPRERSRVVHTKASLESVSKPAKFGSRV